MMQFVLPPNPPPYQMPDQNIPESKKNEEWWLQSVRFFSTFYNRPTQFYSQDDNNENMSPVDKGVQYALYYMGKQRNINYAHITKDTDGNNLQARWIKSKKVKNLVDRMAGILIQQFGNKKISARSLSERAVTEKMNLWQETMLQYDSQAMKIFDELAEMGIEYTPPFGRKFDTKEQAEEWLTYSFKDDLELVATQLGDYIENYNDSSTMYLEGFKQDFAPSNWMGVYNYVENGKVKQKKVPFYNLVWDTTSDDPFVRDGRFAGFIERLTIPEIFRRYPHLNKEQKEELKEIAKGGDYYGLVSNFYNTPNMTWFLHRSGEVTVACVTMFWNGPRDTGFVKKDHPKGGYNYMDNDPEKSTGEYTIMDLHKAVVVGNKFLAEHGYDTNVVRSVNERETPELPIKVLTGNTTLGDGVSIIGSIAQLIDDMDAFDFKIRDLMARNMGRTYIINGSKLGMGVKPKELLQDLKSMGISVQDGQTGEPNDPTNNQPIVSPLDFALDEAIVQYSNLRMQYELRVEELLSLPKIAQGTQQEVVGLGVQRNAIQQSMTGNANLYQNLFKFNQINLQYCVNLAKLIVSRGEGDAISPFIIGDRGRKVIDLVKDRLMEDVLVIVSPNDMIEESQRQQLIGIAQAMAQNGEIDILDFIAIQKSGSFNELENQLEYSVKKKRREKAMEFQAQQQAAIEQEMVRQQGIKEDTAMRERAGIEKKRMESATAIAKEEVKGQNQKELEEIKK